MIFLNSNLVLYSTYSPILWYAKNEISEKKWWWKKDRAYQKIIVCKIQIIPEWRLGLDWVKMTSLTCKDMYWSYGSIDDYKKNQRWSTLQVKFQKKQIPLNLYFKFESEVFEFTLYFSCTSTEAARRSSGNFVDFLQWKINVGYDQIFRLFI